VLTYNALKLIKEKELPLKGSKKASVSCSIVRSSNGKISSESILLEVNCFYDKYIAACTIVILILTDLIPLHIM